MTAKIGEKKLALASQRLGDIIFDLLLEAGRPLDQRELDEGIKGTLGKSIFPLATRRVLRRDSRLQETEGDFDLLARQVLPDRSLDSGVKHLLLAAGRPLSLQQLANELALAKTRSADSIAELIAKLAERDFSSFILAGERLFLREWLLFVTDNEEEFVLLDNFVNELPTLEEFEKHIKLPSRKPATPLALAEKLLEAANEPVSNKYLQWAIWKVFGEFPDAIGFYEQLEKSDFTALLSGPNWLPSKDTAGLATMLVDFSVELQEEDREQLSKLNLAVLLKQPAPRDQQYHISARDKERVHTFLAEREEPSDLADILREVFAVYPSDDTFLAAAHALTERLHQDERFIAGEASETSWMVTEEVPEEVRIIPERLIPILSEELSAEGDPVDAELEDEGLTRGMVNLADFVHLPELEDIGEEEEVDPDIIPDEAPAEVILPVMYHHFVTGMLKYRKLDWGFFPEDEDLVRVTFLDDRGELYNGWVNNELGLVYGLAKWFERQHEQGLTQAGCLIHLKPGAENNQFIVTYEGDQHEKTFVSTERLEELITLRQNYNLATATTFDLVCAVLENQKDGLSPEALWAELNILRRTSKRAIASLLASYMCFNQSRLRPDRWIYDSKRRGQGRMKDKRQYIISQEATGEEEVQVDRDTLVE